jgi:hypothetical protein
VKAAGIGVGYYTRREQGRDRGASPEVPDALAGALRLDEEGSIVNVSGGVGQIGLAGSAASAATQAAMPALTHARAAGSSGVRGERGGTRPAYRGIQPREATAAPGPAALLNRAAGPEPVTHPPARKHRTRYRPVQARAGRLALGLSLVNGSANEVGRRGKQASPPWAAGWDGASP